MFQAIGDIFREIWRVRWTEVFIRFFLLYVFLQIEILPPFERVIHKEEMWLYKNPRTADYVSARVLFAVIIPFPMIMMTLIYFAKRDKADFMAANLAYSIGVGVNGIITDTIKLAVGRPRPDFFFRCFPDGNMTADMNCTNDNLRDVIQGRKSFPSGHSSFSFLSFGFVALYFMGKLAIFNEKGRGSGCKLAFCLSPLMVATMIAISRTCDYHHHWQDVLVGGIIGSVVAYVCYRQYYPPLDSRGSGKPYQLRPPVTPEPVRTAEAAESTSESEVQSLLDKNNTSE